MEKNRFLGGELFVCGRISGGLLSLGKGAGKVVSTPTKVDCLTDFRVKMVALGSEHSIAVTEDDEVLSWGAAGSCRLGHGRQTSILGFSLTSRLYRLAETRYYALAESVLTHLQIQ